MRPSTPWLGRWADVRPLALGAGSAIALVLGVLGHRAAEPGIDFATALLRAAQLFVLEGGGIAGPPWELQIARFLAPAILGYAAIRGALLLGRDSANAWKTRLFASGHAVVAGGSQSTGAIVAGLVAERRRTVAILESAAPIAATLREQGATVLHGDATQAVVLAGARPERAREIVIAPGEDTAAIRALAALEQLLRTGSPPSVHVELLSPELWSELHSLGLVREDRSQVDFFLAADREARVLVGGSPRTLVLDGAGAVLERVVAHAAAAAAIDRRELTLVLQGDAARQRDALVERLPWLDGLPLLTELPADLTAPTHCVVAGLGDADAIAAATRLARLLPDVDSLAASVSDDAVREALTHSRLAHTAIQLVPARSLALGRARFEASGVELLARAKHEDYVARELQRGATVDANPSLVDWDDLPESLRKSNRRFAESVGEKLAAVGATLAPLGAEGPRGDLELDSDLLENLAAAEHDRWVADLRDEGWTHTTGPKDPESKRHPLLVPWEKLSDAEREKDRDGVRALPELLARVGYRLVFREEATA